MAEMCDMVSNEMALLVSTFVCGPAGRHGYIAQWLERLTADQQVPGSNPGVPFLRVVFGRFVPFLFGYFSIGLL